MTACPTLPYRPGASLAAIVFLVGLICGASPCSAAQTDTLLSADKAWAEEKGWNVYWNAEMAGCFAEQRQNDGTLVLFGQVGEDKRLAIGFGNDRLTFVRKDEAYDLELRFDRGAWATRMNAFDFGSGAMLLAIYSDAARFERDFASSRKLVIRRDRKALATISLKGSGAAFKAVRACHVAMQTGSPTPSLAQNVNPQAVAQSYELEEAAIKLRNAGRLSEAEPLYRRVLELREKLLEPEDEAIANALNNLALLLRQKGELTESETLYRRALAIYEKKFGQEHQVFADTLNNLAVLLKEKGDIEGAESFYRRVLSIREKLFGPNEEPIAAILNNIGALLRDKGDVDGAKLLYQRALTIRENALGPNHELVGHSLSNLANALLMKRDFATAEPLMLRALAIVESVQGSDHPDVAQILSNLAYMHRANNDLAKAEEIIRRALSIEERIFGLKHLAVAESSNNLALLLRARGDLAGAEELNRRALAIREAALGPDHATVATSLNNLADVLAEQGNIQESLALVRRAAKAGHPERRSYLATLYMLGAGEEDVIAESFSTMQQTASSQAGAALRSLSLRVSAGGGDLAELVRREQDLAQELLTLERAALTEASKDPGTRNAAGEAAIRERTATVKAELAKVREEMARTFPDYAELNRPSTLGLSDAQQLLSDDEALIIIDSAGREEGADYVWAVTRDSFAWERIGAGIGTVESALSGLNTLANGSARSVTLAEDLSRLRAMAVVAEPDRQDVSPEIGFELYRKLLGPVEQTFAGKAHLIFVLNGAVSALPPQMLVTRPPDSDDLRHARWLIRDHAVSVMPTVSSLKLLRGETQATKAPKPFRGYGDPVFDAAKESEVRTADLDYRSFFRGGATDMVALKAGLPRLPGTARELRAVALSLGVPDSEIILREKATEAEVKSAKLDEYNILYFATHGLVAGEVEDLGTGAAEPALALTIPDQASERDDGLLTASEVAQLRLNASWVVLSACNTAAEGKPGAEALSGLARAFFYAGAHSLLVSHWVVDDEATAELMSRTFAAAAAKPGRRQAEALRDAILSLIDDLDHPEWAAPRYWAPFVLVGEAR